MKSENRRSFQVLTFFMTAAVFFPIANLARSGQDDVVIGKYRTFNSKMLGEDFTFMERLPSGYEQGTTKYPVLFMMNSYPSSNFANAVSTLNHLDYERVPPMILIGISNSGAASRYWPCPRQEGEKEEAAAFLGFIKDELIPYIDQKYRTENYRILMGQSNAGLFVLYAFFTDPDAFNAFIPVSPMIGWCADFVSRKAKDLFTERKSLNKFLYVTYGEFDYPEYINTRIPDFIKIFESAAPTNLEWSVHLIKNEMHVPLSSLNEGLMTLFPDYFATDELRDQGLEAVDGHYWELTKKYGFPIEAPSEVLFNMAHTRMRRKQLNESIEIFEVLLQRYPLSTRGHHFAGETYEQLGDIESAKKCYLRALEITPDFVRSKRRLDALNKK